MLLSSLNFEQLMTICYVIFILRIICNYGYCLSTMSAKLNNVKHSNISKLNMKMNNHHIHVINQTKDYLLSNLVAGLLVPKC